MHRIKLQDKVVMTTVLCLPTEIAKQPEGSCPACLSHHRYQYQPCPRTQQRNLWSCILRVSVENCLILLIGRHLEVAMMKGLCTLALLALQNTCSTFHQAELLSTLLC